MDSLLSSINIEQMLTEQQLFLFSAGGDLGDIYTAVNATMVSKEVKGRATGHCSALIKLLPDYSDLYISQDTWTEYSDMVTLRSSSFFFSSSSYSPLLLPLLFLPFFYRQVLQFSVAWLVTINFFSEC